MQTTWKRTYGRGKRLLASLAVLLAVMNPAAAQTPDPDLQTQVGSSDPSIVVLMYHRFGDSRFPSTNTTKEQLADHIATIKGSQRKPLLLAQIVDHLINGTPLPGKAVAVTVDDAYKSFLTIGWPLFKAAGIPVILFVSPQQIDQGYEDLLTWDEIRQLIREGVAIGHHSLDHRHMPDFDVSDNRESLLEANRRFREELGFIPSIFSYPYGEFGYSESKLVQSLGFDAAFGQHSGAFDRLSHDRFELPRFALNEAYGSHDRIELTMNTLPMPMTRLDMPDRVLRGNSNPPIITFSLEDGLSANAVNCFFSGNSAMTTTLESDKDIKLSFDEPFDRGRSRVNCTAQAKQGDWHWFGLQFYVPKS